MFYINEEKGSLTVNIIRIDFDNKYIYVLVNGKQIIIEDVIEDEYVGTNLEELYLKHKQHTLLKETYRKIFKVV